MPVSAYNNSFIVDVPDDAPAIKVRLAYAAAGLVATEDLDTVKLRPRHTSTTFATHIKSIPVMTVEGGDVVLEEDEEKDKPKYGLTETEQEQELEKAQAAAKEFQAQRKHNQ